MVCFWTMSNYAQELLLADLWGWDARGWTLITICKTSARPADIYTLQNYLVFFFNLKGRFLFVDTSDKNKNYFVSWPLEPYSIILRFCWCEELHPAILRTYFWFFTQESLQVRLRGPSGVSGIEAGSVELNACTCTPVLSLQLLCL